jgi:hypothetical protein
MQCFLPTSHYKTGLKPYHMKVDQVKNFTMVAASLDLMSRSHTEHHEVLTATVFAEVANLVQEIVPDMRTSESDCLLGIQHML